MPPYKSSGWCPVTDQLSQAVLSGRSAAQRRQHLLQLLNEVWEHRHQIHHESEKRRQTDQVRNITNLHQKQHWINFFQCSDRGSGFLKNRSHKNRSRKCKQVFVYLLITDGTQHVFNWIIWSFLEGSQNLQMIFIMFQPWKSEGCWQIVDYLISSQLQLYCSNCDFMEDYGAGGIIWVNMYF